MTVRFREKSVIEGFSLRLAPGEKVILTGRSGAGKSTILKCILGFVLPAAGIIRIDGELLVRESVWRLRREMAYVAQEPDLGEGLVQDVLERPFTYRANFHLRGNLKRTTDLFERLLLPVELLDKEISSLSGGEKQRVALISAILLDRRIFLLDEVSSALDETSERAIAQFFSSDDQVTVLSVSHNRQVFSDSDRIIELPYRHSEEGE